MELIKIEDIWYITDPNKEFEKGQWVIWENRSLEKIKNVIGNIYIYTTSGIRNPNLQTIKAIVASEVELKNIASLNSGFVSEILVKIAHRKLTRHKPEYAPDVHAIQKEILKIINDGHPITLDINDLMRFQAI